MSMLSNNGDGCCLLSQREDFVQVLRTRKIPTRAEWAQPVLLYYNIT